jgi:hypothetical protein
MGHSKECPPSFLAGRRPGEADGALEFGVPKQQLHGSEILRTTINQGRLGPSKRRRAVTGSIQPYLPDPGANNSGLLPRGQMGRGADFARKQSLRRRQTGTSNPVAHSLARRLGDFKLHRALGLLLRNDHSRRDHLAIADIPHTQLHQVVRPQLTVDGKIEERELAAPVRELQGHADGPNLLRFQWRLWYRMLYIGNRSLYMVTFYSGDIGRHFSTFAVIICLVQLYMW